MAVKRGIMAIDKEYEDTLKLIQKMRMKETGEYVSLRRLSKGSAKLLKRPAEMEAMIREKMDDDRSQAGRKRK